MDIFKSNYDGMQAKLKNKGKPMMFIGYSLDHGSNVFKMLNIQTYHTVITRDIVWMGQVYGEWTNKESEEIEDIVQVPNREVDLNDKEDELRYEKNNYKYGSEIDSTNVLSHHLRSDRRLTRRNEFGLLMVNNPEPITYHDAWDHPVASSRKEWIQAIRSELYGMKSKRFWTLKNKRDLPGNIRTIPMKWVFNVKTDRRHRSRLVAKGFKQIQGVDYYNSHAPVLSEIAFRIILATSLKEGYALRSIDVEQEFLEPKLNETLYTTIPPGLSKTTKIKKDMVC